MAKEDKGSDRIPSPDDIGVGRGAAPSKGTSWFAQHKAVTIAGGIVVLAVGAYFYAKSRSSSAAAPTNTAGVAQAGSGIPSTMLVGPSSGYGGASSTNSMSSAISNMESLMHLMAQLQGGGGNTPSSGSSKHGAITSPPAELLPGGGGGNGSGPPTGGQTLTGSGGGSSSSGGSTGGGYSGPSYQTPTSAKSYYPLPSGFEEVANPLVSTQYGNESIGTGYQWIKNLGGSFSSLQNTGQPLYYMTSGGAVEYTGHGAPSGAYMNSSGQPYLFAKPSEFTQV